MINITVKYTIIPTEIFFHIYMYNEKRYVGVIVYFTVMLIIPLVSLLFAVLVSLHPDTFLMFFITRGDRTPGSRG